MRKTTSEIVRAFRNHERRTVGNSYTDGKALFLFGNKIAEYRDGSLWITNAGWSSATTKERLNGLPGVNISQSKGVWYLNGEEWNGEWINPYSNRRKAEKAEPEKEENPFRAMAMVMAMGNVLAGDSQKAKNDWKMRMAKAGMGEGFIMPEDWDTLTEDEKERRLNKVIDFNLKKETK